ncbi:MAG: regulatory protein GemA [Candidatus Binataceae bacterium]
MHIGKTLLGLDDDTYKSVISRVCKGKTSAGDLDETELGTLLDEFKRLGFREGDSYTTKLSDFSDSEPQMRLIRALWSDCHAAGAIRDSSEKALRRFVQRSTKVDSLRWLSAVEANKVIKGLKVMKMRAMHK